MKLFIPPPLLGLITGALIWGAAQVVPQFNLSVTGQKPIGIFLMLGALSVEIMAAVTFFRAKTTVNPMKPDRASTLVATGLYRFSRNPMYASLLVLLTGWSLYLGNPLAIFLLVFFVWYMTRFQIQPEERALTDKFGDDYRDYCSRVRRWF
jgi:protein-S-isoprenylcysteine O-methyltransferase Ste14